MPRNGNVPALRTRERYTIDDYWSAVYRRKWIIVVVVVAAGAIAAGLSSRIEPRYESRADFYVPQDVVSGQPGPEGRNVRVPGLREHARVYVDILNVGDARRAIASRIPDRSVFHLARNVDLTVAPSGSVRVYARDRDPEIAALIANTFVDYFQEFHQRMMRGELQKTLDTLDAELTETRERKRKLQEDVRSFKEQHRIASMSAALAHLAEQKARLQSQLREIDVTRVTTTQRLSALEMQMEMEDQAYQPSELSLAQSAVVRHRQEELKQAELEFSRASASLEPGHPELPRLQRRREIARQDLQEVIETIDSRPRQPGTLYARLHEQFVLTMVELAAAEARAEGLRDAVDGVDAEIEAATTVALGLERRVEEVAIAERFVSKLIATRDDLTSQMLRLTDVIIVTQRARPSSRPVFPKPGLNMIVAIIGGLAVGVMYALFLDYVENRPRQRLRRDLENGRWSISLSEGLARSGHS